MAIQNMLARRVLRGTLKGKRVSRTVTINIPIPNEDGYSCLVRFGGSLGRFQKRVPGKDAFDALQNALVYIAADLFLYAEHGTPLAWDDGQDTGFPTFPGLRIHEVPPLYEPGRTRSAPLTVLEELLTECALIDMYPESKSGFSGAPGKDSNVPAPERGDIVSVLADSKKKRRALMLVLSPRAFNAFGHAVVCPVMQGDRYSRGHGLAVKIGGGELKTKGIVLCHRIRTLAIDHSWRFVEKVPSIVEDVLARARALIV